MIESEITDDILTKRRGYFMEKVKAPLMKAIVLYGKRYPEPTRGNTNNPYSHVLLDIWDEFFELEDNPGRDALFKALRRISVGEIEANNYYSQRLTWFLMKLTQAYLDGKWKPNLPCCPYICWKDPATIAAKHQAIEDMVISMANPEKTEPWINRLLGVR